MTTALHSAEQRSPRSPGLSWVIELEVADCGVDYGSDRSHGAMNSSSEADSIPKVGDLIGGKFRVTEALGQGGMGVVFAGEHLDLRQDVAIKVLRPSLAKEPDALARFLREARAAASIKSRHAVRIYDVGTTDDGVPFMIMERLHGVGVDSLLEREGALPVEWAVQIIVEAADAIAEANGLGIIHRDVKPSNLFLAKDSAGGPLIKVLDFGISKRVTVDDGRESASLTAPQTLLGSPQYMSPEQLRDPRSVDERSDVWGLGVTLYELLTGRVPFECDSIPELCALIFNSTPARADRLQPSVPRALADVIEACLTKRPEDRVPSVAALVGKLVPFCRGEGLTAAEQLAQTARATLDAVPRSSQRRARPPGALVVGAVVALALGGVALLVRGRSSGEPPAGTASTGATQLSAPSSPAASSGTVAGEPSAATVDPAPDAAPAERATASAPSAAAPNRALPPSLTAPLVPPQTPRGRGLKGIKLMD